MPTVPNSLHHPASRREGACRGGFPAIRLARAQRGKATGMPQVSGIAKSMSCNKMEHVTAEDERSARRPKRENIT
jgi:hypothetical protein